MNLAPHIHVGVTGFNAAGKGEVTRYLESLGYQSISLSDILRQESTARKLEPTRENLTRLGQELRKHHHPGFLAEWAVKKLDKKKSYAIDSIRHPDEIKILRDHLKPFILLGIDAPISIRFERSELRGRQENANTIEEFVERENQEKKNNPNAQQLHKCLEMSDILIMNDGNLQHLQEKIQAALNSTKVRQ